MCSKDNIVQLFGEDEKPLLEYMTLCDMVSEILKRVVFLEEVVRKTVCCCKHGKGSGC